MNESRLATIDDIDSILEHYKNSDIIVKSTRKELKNFVLLNEVYIMISKSKKVLASINIHKNKFITLRKLEEAESSSKIEEMKLMISLPQNSHFYFGSLSTNRDLLKSGIMSKMFEGAAKHLINECKHAKQIFFTFGIIETEKNIKMKNIYILGGYPMY